MNTRQRQEAYFDRLDDDLCIELCEQLRIKHDIQYIELEFLVEYLIEKQVQIRKTGREVTPNEVLNKICRRPTMRAHLVRRLRKWEKG